MQSSNSVPTQTVVNKPDVPVVSSGPYDNYALASFILGTLSIISSLIIYPGLVFGIMAIVFGIRGKSSLLKSRLAKVGIILAILGLLSSIFWGVMSIYLQILPEIT